jgi:hypothetical protein
MSTVQVRYIVNHVDLSIEFYTKHPEFRLEMHPAGNPVELSEPTISETRLKPTT